MAATVGFIGAGGIMGRGMALNLLKAGYKLVVWNRTVEKVCACVLLRHALSCRVEGF